jgi:flagellar motility protein MotE (MotC chaperone)
MTRRGFARGALGGPLFALAALLAVSAALRLGGAVSAALAVESPPEASVAEPTVDVAAALAAVRERQAELDRREAALDERLRALAVAERTVSDQLAVLREAEERLRGLMATAAAGADGDLAQLTAVYENMKPKEAAALFERMSPEFAAGFLGRMRPDVAAAVMSGLPPDLAYAISVLLAGRNADAAAFASGQ